MQTNNREGVREIDKWQIWVHKEGEKQIAWRDRGGAKRGGGAEKQRVCVNSMAAVAVTFLAEQISWPEEKDKHRRGNHV